MPNTTVDPLNERLLALQAIYTIDLTPPDATLYPENVLSAYQAATQAREVAEDALSAAEALKAAHRAEADEERAKYEEYIRGGSKGREPKVSAPSTREETRAKSVIAAELRYREFLGAKSRYERLRDSDESKTAVRGKLRDEFSSARAAALDALRVAQAAYGRHLAVSKALRASLHEAGMATGDGGAGYPGMYEKPSTLLTQFASYESVIDEAVSKLSSAREVVSGDWMLADESDLARDWPVWLRRDMAEGMPPTSADYRRVRTAELQMRVRGEDSDVWITDAGMKSPEDARKALGWTR